MSHVQPVLYLTEGPDAFAEGDEDEDPAQHVAQHQLPLYHSQLGQARAGAQHVVSVKNLQVVFSARQQLTIDV